MGVRWYGLWFLLLISVSIFYLFGRAYWHPLYLKAAGSKTVADVLDRYGAEARSVLKPMFQAAGLPYPPREITLLGIKDINQLELWATANSADWVKVADFPIRAASGVLGPKLREGDHQVPEGVYQIIGLNPNSAYHLSMKLNYPNSFDLKWARAENRAQPGSDIFIHGKAVSVGCLAMGDQVIEQLFTLVADVGRSKTQVIIAPTDPRNNALVVPVGSAAWVTELYKNIADGFAQYN